jgi:glycine cleavage system transcriptional repressor
LSRHFAVSAVGADRPGIVAAVSGVLWEQGCNLADTEMAVLRGHFAMMLVVTGPDSLTADGLEAALAGVAGRLDLVAAVREIDASVPVSPAGEPWSVSVYGADQPGIVHRLTTVLAEAGVNVEYLYATAVEGEAQAAVVVGVPDARRASVAAGF